MQIADWGLRAAHLIVDHDTKYTGSFEAVFEAEGGKVKRVGPAAPNMNAYAERWVQTLRAECLNHFVVVGERHLRHLVTEFVAHYNEVRPHQARGNVPLPDAERTDDPPRAAPFPSGAIQCRERLGGLLKHYYRAA